MENKEIIKVYVEWTNKNFCASLSNNVPGAIVITAKDIVELKREVGETLRFHVEGMLADGDDVPQWLVDGNYVFDYDYLSAAALIKACEPYASLAALSRASGINHWIINIIKCPMGESGRRCHLYPARPGQRYRRCGDHGP